jgi:sterol desaturase/sphingolipid hydroxylase (fatty acid hydroxylase superfamily)
MRFWLVRSPLNYWADFVLFPAQAAALVWLAPIAWWQVVAGFITWTLAEYLLHRFVFHGRWAAIRKEHIRHHGRPNSYAGVSSLPTLLVTQACFWASLAIGAAGFLFGFMVGYVCYISSHAACHSQACPAPMRRLHDLHHATDWRGNFGVSTPVWDWIFGTYRRRSLKTRRCSCA